MIIPWCVPYIQTYCHESQCHFGPLFTILDILTTERSSRDLTQVHINQL